MSGTATFSTAGSSGSRWPAWNTNPKSWRRSTLRSPVGHPRQVSPPPRHRPRGRREDAGQHVQQRRLARARRPHDRHALARTHGQGDAPQRRHLAGSERAVSLDDVGRDEPVRQPPPGVAGRRVGGRERSRGGRHDASLPAGMASAHRSAGRVLTAPAGQPLRPRTYAPGRTSRHTHTSHAACRADTPRSTKPVGKSSDPALANGRPRRRNLPTPFRKERRSDSNRGPHQWSNPLDSRDDARGPGALTDVREASDPDTPRPGQLILGRVSPCLRTSRPRPAGSGPFLPGTTCRDV